MRTKKLFKRAAYAATLWALCSVGVAAQTTININTVAAGGDGYTFASGVLTLTQNNGTYNITGTGAVTARRVVVAPNVKATVTISNVNISIVEDYLSAFTLSDGANVTLNVEGIDSIRVVSAYLDESGTGYGSGTAINVPEGAAITIQGNGALYAESDGHAAVIGGGHPPGNTVADITTGEKCGDITIQGNVKLSVNSRFRGPAIGSGANGAELGGDIRIRPGTTPGYPVLDLTIYQDAPVIGSMNPLNSKGHVIEIAGGTVTGHARGDIAYIGGPESRWYDPESAGGVNKVQNPDGIEVGNNIVKISGGKVTLGTIIAANREITGGTVVLTNGFGDVGFSFDVVGTPLGRITNTAQGTLKISGGSLSSVVPVGDPFFEPTDNADKRVYLNTLTLSGYPINLAVTSVTIDGNVAYSVTDVKTDSAGKVYLWLPASSGDGSVSLTAGGVTYARTYTRPEEPIARVLLLPGHPSHAVTFNTNGGNTIAPQSVPESDAVDRPDDPVNGESLFEGWYADAELTQRWNFTDPVMQPTTLHAKWLPAGTIVLDTVSTSGAGYTVADEVLTITASGAYTITSFGAETNRRVVVAAGVTATVTVSGLNISFSDNSLSAFTLAAGAGVTLVVEGENRIVAASGGLADPEIYGSGAAINVPKGASITIQGTGSLYAESGGHSAVIGGAHIPGSDIGAFTTGEECGDVTITGDVTLTVNSKLRGPAIGSGVRDAELGGDIKILAGTKPGFPKLDLTVEQLAPVIGAYKPQSSDNQKVIEIAGGTVTGRATHDIAYIGNASTAWYQVSPDSVELVGYSTVKISGGKVTAGAIVANTKEITGGTVALTEGLAVLPFADYYTNVGLGALAISGGSVNIAALDAGLQPTGSDGATPVYLNTLTLSANPNAAPSHPANVALTAATVGSAAYGIKDVETDGSGKVYLWLPASSGEEEVAATANGVEYKRTYARPAAPIARFLVTNTYPFHTVTFISGDAPFATPSVAEGEPVDEPAKPTTPPAGMEGKAFYGWYTNAAAADSTRWNFANPVTRDTTLYAGWQSEYKVIFVVNDARQDTVKVFDGGKVAPPAAERPGYALEGCYADADFTPGSRWSFDASVVTSDTTLYAKWEIIVYAIEYNDVIEGATNENPTTYTVETLPITLSDAVKEGYDFVRWENYDYEQVTVIEAGATGDIRLWAVLEPVPYTITYNLDGGTNAAGNPATYTIESEAITLADPTRDGYTFGGWYDAATGGNKVTAIATGSTGNVELWAQWSETATTGVESVKAATLPVYPNPTTGIVNVASDGEEVSLYSAAGALLKRTREAQLDLSGYPSGVYVLKAGKKTTKVVKQ